MGVQEEALLRERESEGKIGGKEEREGVERERERGK